MEYQNIEQLIEKYWEGDTNLEEERVLQKFFTEEEVPEHLKGVASLFQNFSADRQFKTLDDSFDEALFHTIEKRNSSWNFSSLLKIAASIALVIAAVLLVIDQKQPTKPQAVVTDVTENSDQDPKLAYEQTKQALLLISSIMNEGTQHMEKLENFSEAQEKIKENTL